MPRKRVATKTRAERFHFSPETVTAFRELKRAIYGTDEYHQLWAEMDRLLHDDLSPPGRPLAPWLFLGALDPDHVPPSSSQWPAILDATEHAFEVWRQLENAIADEERPKASPRPRRRRAS